MEASQPVNTKMPPSTKNKRKCLKICCAVSIILILVIVIVILFLRFYLFRVRAPEISTNDVFLTDLKSSMVPTISLNITLGAVIGIRNPNYAGFVYEGANTTVSYHGIDVGLAPMVAGKVNARSSKSINTTVYIDGAKMAASSSMLTDMILGVLPFTTSTTLVGKVVVFNILKLHATVTTVCTVSVSISTSTSTSDCASDVKV